jgi:DNA (cytosine-5)-methyltransferase 1
MRAIDFFCGAGGLTRGLMDAGMQVVAGIDVDQRCRETYERNNTPARFYEREIRDLSLREVWKILGSRRTSDLLFAGCAPCQPFSKHRKRQRVECEGELVLTERQVAVDSTLLGGFARLVEEARPGQVLVENVPGLTRVLGFSTYRRFLRMLRSSGYHFVDGVIDAKHYGVPQTRQRYVLIAMRGRLPSLPGRLHGPGLMPYATVHDAISHYPPIGVGQGHPRIPNHEAAALSDLNLQRLRSTPHDGGDRRAWRTELYLECHKGDHAGHTDVYGRMAWDRPAPTLTGRCNSISNGRYAHPRQDRGISLREAASLQTFSDTYVFFGSNNHIARQIGNAVPVKLAELLGRHLLSLRYGDGGHLDWTRCRTS